MRCRRPSLPVSIHVGTVLLLLFTGCQTSRRHSSIRTFELGRRTGYIEFVARQREDDRTSKSDSGRSESKELILEERLRLETKGYVYHPNLLVFSLGAMFGLQQMDFENSFSGGTMDTSKDGDILEFDIQSTLFQAKRYPLSLFARRARSITPRPFESSIQTTNTSYGLSWQYVNPRTPIRLNFKHSVIEQDPFLGAGEREGREENTILRLEAMHRFSDRNVLSFDYNHEELEQRPFPTEYVRDRVRLRHRLEFGGDKRHSLESQLDYETGEGTFDSDLTRWTELLSLNHTERLRSWYKIEAFDRNQGSVSRADEVSERSYNAEAGLEHRLYESLESRLLGFFWNQDFGSDLSVRRAGFQADFDYRKKNRWGVLRGTYRLRFERRDQSEGQVDFEVVDRPSTFVAFEPLVLQDDNITRASIMLLREDRTELYEEGRDYVLTPVGDGIEIERVATGRIEDGETVLVSYRFRIVGGFDLDTLNQSFSLRQEFAFGLSPYYRFAQQRQDMSPPGASGITPEDIDAHTVGVEYRRGPLRLKAEHTDHKSNVRPFRAVRLRGSYRRDFKNRATLGLGASWAEIDQGPPRPRDTRIMTAEARYSQPITERLMFQGGISYGDQTGTSTGRDRVLRASFSLDYSIRKTELHVKYEFSTLDDDFTEEDSSTLYIQIRRRF